jgi:hypothetical protein
VQVEDDGVRREVLGELDRLEAVARDASTAELRLAVDQLLSDRRKQASSSAISTRIRGSSGRR